MQATNGRTYERAARPHPVNKFPKPPGKIATAIAILVNHPPPFRYSAWENRRPVLP